MVGRLTRPTQGRWDGMQSTKPRMAVATEVPMPGVSDRAAVVRDARPEEFDEVAGLLIEAYREFESFYPPDVWKASMNDIANVRGRLGDAELLVAEDVGRLAGTITLFPDATRSSIERWPTGWASIRTTAVRPAMRGQGIGELLVAECIRRARSWGAMAIGLHTAWFMKAAVALYERLGFVRAPEHDLEIAGMFLGNTQSAKATLVAQAFRLDLRSDSSPREAGRRGD